MLMLGLILPDAMAMKMYSYDKNGKRTYAPVYGKYTGWNSESKRLPDARVKYGAQETYTASSQRMKSKGVQILTNNKHYYSQFKANQMGRSFSSGTRIVTTPHCYYSYNK